MGHLESLYRLLYNEKWLLTCTTGHWFDYYSNWLDLIYVIDCLFVIMAPKLHEKTKLIQPVCGGFSFFYYWIVIASDTSRLSKGFMN